MLALIVIPWFSVVCTFSKTTENAIDKISQSAILNFGR